MGEVVDCDRNVVLNFCDWLDNVSCGLVGIMVLLVFGLIIMVGIGYGVDIGLFGVGGVFVRFCLCRVGCGEVKI